MSSQQVGFDTVGCANVNNYKLLKIQEYKTSGNERFSERNYKGAVIEYRKGLQLDPANTDLHTNLAAAYIHLEKYVEASEHAVYAMYLKPTFYKGYLRAAKAAHGHGMTRHAIKHLEAGLKKVTDTNGIKELTKLKTQYTGYMSLRSNAEKELELDTDSNDSEDEPFSDEDDDPHKGLPKMPKLVPISSLRNIYQSSEDDECCIDEDDNGDNCDGNEQVSYNEEKKAKLETEIDCTGQQQNQFKTETKGALCIEDNKTLETVKESKSTSRNKEEVKSSVTAEAPSKPLEFNDHLKSGSEAFSVGNYRKAADCFKIAEEKVLSNLPEFEMDIRQVQIIRYAYATALINLESYDEIVKGLQALQKLEEHKSIIPAVYAQMAQAYCKLNRFKAAASPLAQLNKVIEDCPIFPTFTWPGTNDTIEETTPSGLKKYISELSVMCNMSHKPTAVCRYINCYKTSTHIVPSDLIFNSDPDFIGYVRMTCEEKCYIEFHIPCWKAYKESTKSGVGKVNDKDLLGHGCLTTDCVNSLGKPSVVVSIEIIGSDRKVKSLNRFDPKTDMKTSKKRKVKIDDTDKNKDKEKEKTPKLKKMKEKKIQEMKKIVATMDDEEYVIEEETAHVNDLSKAMAARKEQLMQLRAINFGLGDRLWDPKLNCYGRPEEIIKFSSENPFSENTDNVREEVKGAKEFFFSLFMTALKDEGPMKITEIEEQWKDSTFGFCDISIVLPNLRYMRDLLLESTIFCQLEDYICLSDQLEEQYEQLKNDRAEVVKFLLLSNDTPTEDLGNNLPKELHHHQEDQIASQSSSDVECNIIEEESEGENQSADSESENDSDEETEERKLNEVPFKTEDVSMANDISFIDILNEMTRVKSNIMKHPEESGTITKERPAEENCDSLITEKPSETSDDERISNEDNTSDDEIKISPCQSIDISEANLNIFIKQCNSIPTKADGKSMEEYKAGSSDSFTKENENLLKGSVDHASQCGETKDREIQTLPAVTKDSLSQTMESEHYKELTKKVETLTNELERVLNSEMQLKEEVADKDHICNTLKASFEDMKLKYDKALTSLKTYRKKKEAECTQKEAEYQQKEQILISAIEKMREEHTNMIAEKTKIQKEVETLLTKQEKLKKSMAAAETNVREFQKKAQLTEQALKNKVTTLQKNQLATLKDYWEKQISILRRRCVEKISEMQSWFSMCPPEEVEDLPSWGDIRQNTLKWSQISSTIHSIEANFQTLYKELESKINKGEELSYLTMAMFPTLPEEPTPLPLDKIHKEITEKYLKKISELTQLVVNQQLEIEKSKEANLKIQQLMNTFQMSVPPRTQSPMTTAFGSLALKYPYPQFSQSSVSSVPSSSQDTTKVDGGSNMIHTDVQALLQESSKTVGHPPIPTQFGSLEMNCSTAVPPPSYPNLFNTPPPLLVAPTHMPPPVNSMPPPVIGVAQSLLKSTTAINEKKELNSVPPTTSKSEPTKSCSSRELTSLPTPLSTPTPEKSKKKKKNKSESKETSENNGAVGNTLSVKQGPLVADYSVEEPVADTSDWNVVLPKSAIVKQSIAAAPVQESKVKNKKKLLDKLQLKFPNTSMKEIDEIVKLVREQNNGSLSGLPFHEIESRVERVVVKRQFNKASPYGLAKLSSSAWGTIKPQENIVRSDLEVDECTICLELLGSEKTKIDCNHEFHTKCLRKWLKEKRVCPLCNKFTTMPDEFPAL